MGMACLMLRFYHPTNSSAPIPAWIRVYLWCCNKDLKMREQRRHRDYFISFTLSIIRELSWSWIRKSLIQVKKDKENFVVACLHPRSIKYEMAFSRRSLAKTAKKCTKKCDARAKLLFCLNLLPLWRSRCRRRRLILRSIICECNQWVQCFSDWKFWTRIPLV